MYAIINCRITQSTRLTEKCKLHVMVDNAECLSVMYVIRIYKVYLFLNFTDSILCIHNYNYYNHVPQALIN